MKNFKKVYLLIVLFFVLIIFLASIMPISGDEAYYWVCSKNLDFSYFDQPPLVIWLAGAFSKIFKSNLTIRLPSIIFTFLTLILFYKFLKEKGFIIFLILHSALIFFYGSFYLSTDKALSFFYLWATYLILKLKEENKDFLWFLLGVSFGLGFLSKFPMVLISPLIFYVIYKNGNLKKFFFFLIPLMVISSPVFIYSFKNDWVNFTFQLFERHKEDVSILKFICHTFLPNLILLGPIFFIKGIYEGFKNYKKNKILFFSGAIPLLFFSLTGIKNPGAPHWICLGFFSFAFLQIDKWNKKILKFSIILNLAFLIFSFFLIFLYRDFYFKGSFKDIEKIILNIKKEKYLIASTSYTISSLLSYNLNKEVYLYNFNKGIHGLSYLYWQKKKDFYNKSFLLITNKNFNEKNFYPYFEKIKDKGKVGKLWYFLLENCKDPAFFYP